MGLDLTPNEVVSGLLNLSRELSDLATGLDKLERDAVEAREDFTLAYSTAYLKADGTVEERKHRAVMQTSDERIKADLAEALVRGRKRQLDTIKVRIDVGRSAAAALRAEIDLTR